MILSKVKLGSKWVFKNTKDIITIVEIGNDYIRYKSNSPNDWTWISHGDAFLEECIPCVDMEEEMGNL